MRAPPNYRLGKPLHATASSEVFAAVRESDALEVVLKRYGDDRCADGSRASLAFAALRAVAGPGVPEALEVAEDDEGPVLVMARVPGISIQEWAAAGEIAVPVFLQIALQLTQVLGRLHDVRLVHRDVCASNVLVDPEQARAHLVDFDLARPLGAAALRGDAERDSDGLVGDLRYVSPEQTGRMDRGVDSRSDLYSLGAVLYCALTGRPPFESDDALSLIHAHMARLPASAVSVRPGTPATLSRIVAKLLQKAPEDRYQTPRALQRDLLECQQQLERTGRIDDDLPLGSADAPYRPLFSRRLYGREEELRTLLDAYARAAAGSIEVLWIGGPPGIGKSALVNELRTPLVRSRGHLADAKFDLYRRDVPYGGFLQALDSLTQQLLTESDADLARWCSTLRGSLGGIARVLVELVPDLAAVIGETPAVPALGPSETRARLSLAIQRFVAALAAPEHPLVLFLDDVHWADAGSRELLRDLLLQSDARALLVLGVFRDGEVDASHPLRYLMAELDVRGRPMVTLTLGPLEDDACARMLADALGRTPEESRSLAACVARKTGSTPLFIHQFVQHMYDEGLIRFDAGRGWSWDEAALAAAPIPDDAVALMTAKIGRLEESTRGVLKVASCVGDHFDGATLAELADLEVPAVLRALYRLADEGLLAPCPDGFRFVHDRVREAAQSMWPEFERRDFHDRVGRRLLARSAPAELEERIFEILDHLNRASDRIGSEAERAQRIELNLRAGRRALKAGAAGAAERYLSEGRSLLRDTDWTRDPATCFEVQAQSAECAFSSRRYDAALAFLDGLEPRQLAPLQRGRVAARRTSIYALTRTQRDAVDAGLAGLAQLGFRIPAEPSALRVWLTTLRSRWLLRKLREDDLRPPDASNPRWLPAQLILRELIGPAFRSSWRLQSLIGNVALRSGLRWGTAGPAFTISGPAMTVAYYTQNYTLGSKYADLVLRILERQPGQSSFFRARMSVFAFIKAFVIPRREVIAELGRCRDDAVEHGDVSFALYAENLRGYLMWIVGDPLADVARNRREFLELSRNLGYADWRSSEHFLAVFAALTSETTEVRETLAPELLSSPLLLPIRSAWMACHYMRGEHRVAFERSEELLGEIDRVYCNLPHVPEYWLFRGLSAARLADGASRRVRAHYRRALRRSARRMRRWARHGPMNFEPAALLLEAERARLARDPRRALTLCKRSAESAKLHGLPHHEALAHEVRARLLLALRREVEAGAELSRAAQLYAAWGAQVPAARVQRLDA
jgi:serine/threonine protein kinase